MQKTGNNRDEIKKLNNKKIIYAVDLFCGVGGLTYGLNKAGINVLAGIDIDESCQYPYEKNNDSKFINEDIKNISPDYIKQLYPENSYKLLAGCAPCQPFSKYTKRYRKKGVKDEKWDLLYAFSNIIKEVKPDFVTMENVPGLAKEKVFTDFIDNLEALNYKFSWQIVFCPKYGVPQKRRRLVLLASLINNIQMIQPLYKPEGFPTVRDAIGELPELKAGEANDEDQMHRACSLSEINIKRIKQSRQGGTWRDWDDELKLKCHLKKSGSTYPSVYGRMNWNQPSPTITTQFFGYGNGRFGHPEQNRALSLREGAILQSFPKDYIFEPEGKKSKRLELGIHIGNAVPVELGYAIGLSFERACGGDELGKEENTKRNFI